LYGKSSIGHIKYTYKCQTRSPISNLLNLVIQIIYVIELTLSAYICNSEKRLSGLIDIGIQLFGGILRAGAGLGFKG